jgi:hypothetical protein
MFSSSISSVDIFDNNTLINIPSAKYNNETNIYNTLWTLQSKPPTRDDALNFIDKFKNVCHNKQLILKYNNVIERVKRDLLSLSFPVNSDLNFFASESLVILEPLKQPPSYLKAFKWLEIRNSKYKHKKITLESCKRKGYLSPESFSKSIMFKKINQSTPNSNQSKLCTSSPYTPTKKEKKKSLKSKRKLSTLFLDSLYVRI